MKITHNDKTYTLDIEQSLKLGVLKPDTNPIRFDELENDTLFLFDNLQGDVGIYIKTDDNLADRIAGINGFKTEIGKVDIGAWFTQNSCVKIYKDGKWVGEQ